jgi:hypothetical protein
MNQQEASGFWDTVLAHADVLRAPALLTPESFEWSQAVDEAMDKVDLIDDAARAFDQRLSVEFNQVPAGEGSTVLLAVSCGCDPAGIDTVRALVDAAPALPAGLSACAFKPAVPWALAEGQGPMDLLGKEVVVQTLRYMAKPSADEPGAFDIACFVPTAAVTDMDQGVPGSLASQLVLGMGIGELKLMTKVARIGVAVTAAPPADAVTAWELDELLGP